MGGLVPTLPPALAQKVKQNCADGDPVCTNSGTDPNKHLEYVEPHYMKSSAEYIAQQLKTDGKAGPSPSKYGGAQDKGDNKDALKKLGETLGGSQAQLASFGQ